MIRRLWLLLILCTLLLGSQGLRAQVEREIPYALTISGGISLGAYEAGLNWTLLRYLKQGKQGAGDSGVYPRLVAVTGASAGSINGLLSALSWCVDETRLPREADFADTVTRNLFRDIWVEVGFDTLLPGEAKGAYGDGDGLLTRKAFERQIARIKALSKRRIYRPDCRLPLGLVVTRETPYSITVAGLQVQSQRHFIPLWLRGRADGSLSFVSRPLAAQGGDWGRVIYLPAARADAMGPEYPVAVDDVIDAVLTSSAFPFAFGRKRLAYCYEPWREIRPLASVASSHHCPAPLLAAEDVFLDGGVFDNVPLGSTRALAERERGNSLRRINYVFMDPGKRRALQNGEAETAPAESVAPERLNFDLASQARFIPGFFDTAQGYELYKVLTGGAWDNTVFTLVQRMSARLDSGAGPLPVPDCLRPLPEGNLAAGAALAYLRRCLAELEHAYQYVPESEAHLRSRRTALLDSMARIAGERGWEGLAARVEQARRHTPLGDRRILLSSRFYPISGQYLGHFGAFFERGFREFDYYAGVYDAVNDIAAYACRFRQTSPTFMDCQKGEVAQELFRRLGLAADANARFVFSRLGSLEHGTAPDWRWLAELSVAHADARVQGVAQALRQVSRLGPDGVFQARGFDAFVEALRQAGYPGEGEYYRYLLANDDTWWMLLAQRSVDRLVQLEQDYRQTGGESYFYRSLKLVSRALHIRAGDEVLWQWQPRSFEVGLGYSARGDLFAAWRPRFLVLDRPVLALNLGWWRLSGNQPARDFLRLGGELNFGARRNLGLSLDVYRALRAAGAYDRGGFGLALHLDISRIRLRFGVRDVSDTLVQSNAFVSVSYLGAFRI